MGRFVQGTRWRLFLAIWIWLCPLAMPQAHADEIATVTVYYRSAEAIAEQLQAMFSPEEAKISGLKNQLIIRSSNPATVTQIKELVASLDTRPHQFRISLRQDNSGLDQQQSMGAGGTISNRGSDVRITTQYSTRNSQGANQQTVTVLEDNAVLIQQGQLRPVRDFWIGHRGVATSTHYQSLGDALVVTPRLVGDGQVQLSVHASHSNANATRQEDVDQLELVTERIVSPGDWVELGGVSQSSNDRDTGVIHYSTRQKSNQGSYQIKVDLLD